MSRIIVFGGGAFGTALGAVLARAGHNVTLWMRNEDAARHINHARENTTRLPGVPLPDTLTACHDLDALDTDTADTLLLVLPAQKTRGFLEENSKYLRNKPVLLCAKGIDRETGLTQSQIARAHLDPAHTAVLTGPGFAHEIARGLPTALTLAAPDPLGESLQTQLSTDTLRLYRNTDILGAELGGALKNVIAIGCGIAIGAGLGASARAALLTRGFREMSQLAIHMGAEPDTLTGLSGFGDLVLTATSEQSRNYALGLEIGRSGNRATTNTVEGAATAAAALSLAQKYRLDMPITTTVAAIVAGDIDTKTALQRLFNRPLKEED